MKPNNNTLLTVYNGLIGFCATFFGYYLIDIHKIVKETHDASIAHGGKILQHENEIAVLQKSQHENEISITQLEATLPERIKVKPKQ